jgi:four helix bundle protein
MGKFQDLKVWQKSKNLAVLLYNLTGKGDFSKDFGLRDQIRRAAVSVASNIAEGDELGSDKQAIKFFYIAKGSSAELLTQAIIAFEIGYLDKESFKF